MIIQLLTNFIVSGAFAVIFNVPAKEYPAMLHCWYGRQIFTQFVDKP